MIGLGFIASLGTALALNSSEPAVKARQDPQRPLARRTAAGAMLGLSSSGLALRHQWHPRIASQLALYSTFGRRLGSHRVGSQFQVVLNRNHTYVRFYVSLPLQWVYLREPTERHANFGADPRVRKVHKFRLGVGGGVEVFLGAHVALTLELPLVWQRNWVSIRNERRRDLDPWEWFLAPNLGLYVYFR